MNHITGDNYIHHKNQWHDDIGFEEHFTKIIDMNNNRAVTQECSLKHQHKQANDTSINQ